MTTTPLSELDRAAADFRNALVRRDDEALKRLMAAYQPAYTRMQARVAALTAQIATAQAAGETVRPSWLVERERLSTLQHQIVAEWARFADAAEQVITETQRAAVAAAHSEARQLTQAALRDAGVTTGADVVRLPLAAMQDLIGVLGDGSPLRGLLNRLGQQAAQDVGDALTHAVTVGRNPRRTARDIRDALGGDLNRALTIARTEQMRAYRSASLRNYQANSDILRGWQWRATSSRRTCPVCLAMDGTEHGLDDPFASHQCCRCCPVPLLRDRETPPRETGAEWFANQDAATQRAMLGPGKHDLYKQGKLTLADLVGVKEDARWGKSRYQRSIGDALAAASGGSSGGGSGSGSGPGSGGTPPDPKRLMLDAYAARRMLSPQEHRAVLEHIAAAPFNSDLAKVRVPYRTLVVHGQPLGSRPDSLTWHLAQRILLDEQWTSSTTTQEYLNDIRAAVLHQTARTVVYQQGTRMIAGVLSEYRIPAVRQGTKSLPLFYVVYEIDRAILLSGYQVSALATIAIPGDAVWLRP